MSTADFVKEAAKIAASFLNPTKETSTQTPDVWMTNINGSLFIFVFSKLFIDILNDRNVLCNTLLEQPFAFSASLSGPPPLKRGSSVKGRPGLSRQSSGLRPIGSPNGVGSPVGTSGKSMGLRAGLDSGGGDGSNSSSNVPRDGSLEIFNHKMHATYKLETPAACALVGYIYETKVRLRCSSPCVIRIYYVHNIILSF
jgi:hypothetical protein